MAPIPHSCDLKVSACDAKACEREEPSKGSWDVALPISRRGSFFQDSFFSDVHDEFDATVRRVLGRWRDADLSLRDRRDDSCRYSDILKRYRQLRSLNLREEDQVVTVTTDTSAHKIVVDVHDFLDGEVKVKVVGEKEVVVEGREERREGGGSSSHSFRRRFSLPHFTDMSAITSVMSSDGILTITAPKLEESHQRTTIIPIKLEEVESSVLSRTTDKNEPSSVENTREESNCSRKHICNTMKKESINIPSHVKEGNSLQPRSVEIQISRESINDDVCDVGKLEDTVQAIERTKSDIKDESNLVCKELDSTGLERSGQGFWDELLPITRRGSFFQDSFFSDMHQKFDAAIKKVLDRWSTDDLEWTDTGNDVGLRYKDILQRYRELRSRHLEENLAVTVTSDKTGHKIVMDVHEFTDGKVKVRVVGERELVVEGSAEKKAEGNWSISSHSFRRRFSLPRQTDMAAITSVMSSDGILTITAPKVDCKLECLEEIKEISGNRRLNKEEESRDAKRPLCIKMSESSAAENVCFPLTKMGLFFHDSFFKDSTEEFRKAVREILTRWGEASPEVDDLTRYRILRSRDPREETQAVTSLEDDRHHKFVIDVHDFVDGGEVSVKAVNERELVVEGQLEKKGDGSRSSRRFLRRFVVPGDIELEAVTSVTSSDGVLTVSAPKKKPLLKFTNETQKRDTKEARNTNQKTNEFMSNETYLCSSEKCQRKESIVPIQLENEEVAVPVVHEGNTADALVSADKVEQKHSSADLMSPTSDDDDDEGYTFIVRQPGNSYRVSFGDDEESHAWRRDSLVCDPESKYALKSSGFDCVNRNLPIVRKGLFADDCCFENVRHKYSQAVREVLEKANEWSCRSDAMDNYRKLRQQKVNLENQAVGVSEDSESHKIVMDVFDFISGDVTVRLVEGKELLVEGQAEKQDGSRLSRVSFVRRFALPELVDRDAISCVLSSDGILTIISGKKGKAHGERDHRRSPQ